MIQFVKQVIKLMADVDMIRCKLSYRNNRLKIRKFMEYSLCFIIKSRIKITKTPPELIELLNGPRSQTTIPHIKNYEAILLLLVI